MKGHQKQKIEKGQFIRDVRIGINEKNNIFSKVLRSELFMDALSTLLLSTGCLMALLVPTQLNNGLFASLFFSAIWVFLMVLFHRKWWLLPIVFLGISFLYFIYQFWTDNLSDSLSYFWSFINWVASGAHYVEDVTDANFLLILHIIIAFVVVLVLFILIRKLFYLPIIFLLQMGVLILSYKLMDSDLSGALCLSSAGLIILLPRVYAKRIMKLAGTSKEIKGRTEVSRARMQAVAIPAAAISIFLTLWFLPQNTMPWKSHEMNAWVEDFGTLFSGPFSKWSGVSSNFSLFDLGFQAETGKLGGPARLNGDVYLAVRTENPVLLKGRVMDYYDGHGWNISRPDGDLRFLSLFWNGTRKETFDLDKPIGSSEAASLYGQLTTDTKVTIIYGKSSLTTLFVPENVKSISFANLPNEMEAYFNRRSELYMHYYIPLNAEYTVSARVWNTGMKGFDELFTSLEEQVKDQKEYPAIVDRYTQLPDDLPAMVRDIAASITEGIDSPYLKACAIRKWLAENMNYTLDPDIPPDDVDFTEHFLETKKGYCVYYATAMTVLARCASLPARYVTGFTLEPSTFGKYYQATGLTAHAWCEVYFEGIGWLPMDPLNFRQEEPQSIDDTQKPEQNINTTQYSGSPVQPYEAQTPQNTQNENSTHIYVYVWLFILLIPALYGLFRLILWFGPRHKIKIWNPEAVRKRWPNTNNQLDAIYDDILRLLKMHILIVDPGETLVTFPKRVDQFIVFNDVTLKEIADVIMRSHFGDSTPSDDDIKRACLYHEHLESLTLEHLGEVKYLFKRVFKGTRHYNNI